MGKSRDFDEVRDRKGEDFFLNSDLPEEYFKQKFIQTITLEDMAGVDALSELVGSEGKKIGLYIRTRFNNQNDLTFSRVGPKKIISNCKKYKMYAILQYAEGDYFDDPDFRVYRQTIIKLYDWMELVNYNLDNMMKEISAWPPGEEEPEFYIWRDWKSHNIYHKEY